METEVLDQTVLALLFASDEPLSAKKISGIIDGAETNDIRESIKRITERLGEDFPSLVLESVAGGWQLSTNPQFADFIARLYSSKRKQRLSKAALETLAIIAYKQPVTRADIENIRGVGCGGVVTTLMERTLIRIVGKARVLGAPFLYGTTPEFLEYLGINSVKDLPSMEELEQLLETEESNQAAAEEAASEDNEVAAEDNEVAAEDNEVAAEDNEVAAEDSDVAAENMRFDDPEPTAGDDGAGKVESAPLTVDSGMVEGAAVITPQPEQTGADTEPNEEEDLETDSQEQDGASVEKTDASDKAHPDR